LQSDENPRSKEEAKQGRWCFAAQVLRHKGVKGFAVESMKKACTDQRLQELLVQLTA